MLDLKQKFDEQASIIDYSIDLSFQKEKVKIFELNKFGLKFVTVK